jgi:type II secretory pathway pseudopilin PulG
MIEVIAIIALLGIILVISMPKFFSMRWKQSKRKRKNDFINS